MLDFTPTAIAFQLGPLPVYWYGIGYAIGLGAAYQVLVRLARWAGENRELVANGMIVVAIAALIGGRAYHVIDQWALYKDNLLKIVLPPYTGLGVYGGIALGLVALVIYARRLRQPIWRWADIIAPALFTMEAVARWGNFFNASRPLPARPDPTRRRPWGSTFSRSSCMSRSRACSAPPSSSGWGSAFAAGSGPATSP
jgi:prolipoprotein diacylglyceryl transferase